MIVRKEIAKLGGLQISSSPDWVEDMEPLANTTPAVPVGERWCRICCSHAKLALPLGGGPYFQRTSSGSRSPPQSEMLNGGLLSRQA